MSPTWNARCTCTVSVCHSACTVQVAKVHVCAWCPMRTSGPNVWVSPPRRCVSRAVRDAASFRGSGEIRECDRKDPSQSPNHGKTWAVGSVA